MFTLEELEQFAAFAEAGTLSQAAEKLHISQPTITRTMQHLEECFKVPLFVRGKNRIYLNETGRFAVEPEISATEAAPAVKAAATSCRWAVSESPSKVAWAPSARVRNS